MNKLFRKYIERLENLAWLEKEIQNQSLADLREVYEECVSFNLLESSLVALREICKKANSDSDINYIVELLNNTIFKHESLDVVKEYFLKIVRPSVVDQREKKQVFFHLYGWLYGGAERALSQLMNGLCDHYDITIVVFSPVKNNTFPLSQNIKFMEIMQETNNVKRLYKLVKLLSPDVFIGNNNSIPDFLPIYEWLSGTRIKTIAYCHEYYFFMHQNDILCKKVPLKNYYLNKADAVVFLTSFSANAYSLINDNGARIPNPLSMDDRGRTVKLKTRGENRKKVLAVGRYFDYIKRIDIMLKVFAEVLKREPETELTIVGPFNMELYLPEERCTVTELMNKLHLDKEHVHFVGNQADVTSWYEKNDIFVLTSDNEGFPMVLGEAGIFGLPCVIFDIPGLEDIIVDGENGFVVQHDIKEMASKILQLIKDDTLLESMSINAKKHVEKFRVENVCQEWIRLVDRLILDQDRDVWNAFLKTYYRENIVDVNDFARRIFTEYENCMLKITKN